jgi:hypothetical protein
MENKIQAEMVKWFRNSFCKKTDNPQCVIFSVPNEGRNKMEQMQKVAMGLYSGVSDLIVVKPHEIIFIEVKDAKGVQSTTQREFEAKITNLGFKYVVVRTLDEFKEYVK